MKLSIYLASPWFIPETAERQSRICNFIKSLGFNVLNPREMAVDNSSTKDAMTTAFLNNINDIEKADLIVAITDGKDMGTIWEAGYAFGIKKPIVYYAETLGNNQFNLMLAKSAVGVARNEEELKTLLESPDTYHYNKFYDTYKGAIE